MSIVQIKQIPDDYAESTGLAKYNRSRMPGCRDGFQASVNIDGRFVTGIDDEAYGVTREKAEKLKEKRVNLEKLTGKKLDALSDYWETFLVEIYADSPKTYNLDNAVDYISYNLLIANRFVAPTKDDAFTAAYKDAQYYAFTEEGEADEELTVRKKRDKALSALLGISENKEKMLLYGQYLEGIKYSDKFSPDTLYKMLRTYIDDKDVKKSLNFLNALEISVEEMQQKIIVDRALKQRLISKVGTGSKKQVYQYGQVTLGSTLEEVYKNLSSPDFAPELMALQNELRK